MNAGVNSGVNGACRHKEAWRINGVELAFYAWASCKPDVSFQILIITSPLEGVARYCFHPVCLCVCLSVCVLSVCPANILVFYFSAIRRDIDL